MSMHLIPGRVKIPCPYCGAKIWVPLELFRYQNIPITVECDTEEEEACHKFFAARIRIEFEPTTQLLSGE